MKAKIQRSMLLVLFVTILIFYGLLTLVMYQKNLTLLKEEVNQEAMQISGLLSIFRTSVSERNGRSGYKNPGHENQYGGKGAL